MEHVRRLESEQSMTLLTEENLGKGRSLLTLRRLAVRVRHLHPRLVGDGLLLSVPLHVALLRAAASESLLAQTAGKRLGAPPLVTLQRHQRSETLAAGSTERPLPPVSASNVDFQEGQLGEASPAEVAVEVLVSVFESGALPGFLHRQQVARLVLPQLGGAGEALPAAAAAVRFHPRVSLQVRHQTLGLHDFAAHKARFGGGASSRRSGAASCLVLVGFLRRRGFFPLELLKRF